MYKSLIRPLLYAMPPERAHYFTAGMLQLAHALPLIRQVVRSAFTLRDQRLERNIFGLTFPNPVGLAAGFDKDARWIAALEDLGFGFIEVGTLTPKPQPGNPPPRLFRLREDEALINRMGFNNRGVEAAATRLRSSHHRVPVGGNIGKNKVTPNEEAVQDYLLCFKSLYDHVDYFTVNVSSPNTPGLRELQGKEQLKQIFDALFNEREKHGTRKPVLLKIAPDLSHAQLDDIVALCKETGIDGLIATNTTISRENLRSSAKLASETGGLSGKPVREKSTAVIRYIYQASGGSIPIIGVGGIHSPEDALEKFAAGASLVQLYTGFIYEGPALVKHINEKILKA